MRNLHRQRELQATLERRLAERTKCKAEIGLRTESLAQTDHWSTFYHDTIDRAQMYIDQNGIEIKSANDMYRFLEYILPGADRRTIRSLQSTDKSKEEKPSIHIENYYGNGSMDIENIQSVSHLHKEL